MQTDIGHDYFFQSGESKVSCWQVFLSLEVYPVGKQVLNRKPYLSLADNIDHSAEAELN